ncbi:hypothetical protein scyTo_0010578 [Scyliorhinus torazame]|uniref:Uncharacterized protein n=1 Tax=Scyliorhinus torazame TaxID=75743 RepID=A0A401P8R6_SCYTO|nr:hypothetical protein [Scyliorhinus torazame]
MDAGLKPEKLNLEARTPEAKEIFKYCVRCFEAYLDSAEIPILGPRKLSLLHAQVSHRIFATLEKARLMKRRSSYSASGLSNPTTRLFLALSLGPS